MPDKGVNYTVQLFAKTEQTGPFDERETKAGLRFFTPDAKGAHQDLVMYENGKLVIGTDDADEDLPQDVAFVKSVLQEFKGKLDQRDMDQERKKGIWADRRRAVIRRALWSTGIAGGLAATVLGVPWGAIGHDISEAGKSDVTKFDEHRYRLPASPAVGAVGKTITPAFSQELYSNPNLTVTKVPRVSEADDPQDEHGYYDYPLDQELSVPSPLREIIITSSKPGKNCQAARIHNFELGARLLAWTDFVGATGQSRASELKIDVEAKNTKFNMPAVVACWYGQERNKSDDPRIVFKLRR